MVLKNKNAQTVSNDSLRDVLALHTYRLRDRNGDIDDVSCCRC